MGRITLVGVASALVILVSGCFQAEPGPTVAVDESIEDGAPAPSPAGVAALERLLDAAVTDGRVTAAIAMLAVDGEIAWLETAGEMEPGVPMRDDAIMPLASVGKMFTATAAMMLYERGVIGLDDPVSDYIPEFEAAQVEVSDGGGEPRLVTVDQPMTIAHLLTHTGGLTVTGDAFWYVWDEHVAETTTTHFARDLVAMPLFAQPGEAFRYGQTGASYEVLGAVIEIASGQTLEEFMADNLFEPLGLDDSSFYVPPDDAERLPAIYRRVDDALELDRPRGEDFSRSTFFHGGGGVRSSARDLLTFARLFLEGGSVDGVRILAPETVEMMTSDQLGELAPERWQSAGRSWGFGGAVEGLDEGRDEHELKYGWAGGGFAQLWVDPRHELVAYINVPLTPPGDYDLLGAFEAGVEAAFDSRD